MNRLTLRLALFITITLLALGNSRATAVADQVVSDCGDSGGPNQLRAKLSAAQISGGTITFTCGPGVTLTGSVLPTITANITIDGGNTIYLSGNNASRLFIVNAGATLTLNNLTVTKGYADGDGGALYSSGTLNINNSRFVDNQTTLNGSGGALIARGVLNISNSEFANNKAANGGALYVKWPAAVAVITGSRFHDNQTTDTTNGWGGAILIFDGASATINGGSASANKARFGGAIYVYQPVATTQLTVTNASLSGNNANPWDGGAILNYYGTVTVSNSTFSGNSARAGGGVYVYFGSATLTNVTFSGNTATDYGAGIANDRATATLTNGTLSGNASPSGAGAYNNPGTFTLKNTAIAKGATGPNCTLISAGSFNLSNDNSCGFGTGRDGVTLYLGALANNGGPTLTHMPQPPSPAIDGGTGAGCPAIDQRGASRLGVGTACDVGAVEYGAKVPWLWLPLVVR